MRRSPGAACGFTLLELMAAIVIFALMSSAVLINQQQATDKALGSVRARELRTLAERKLGEIQVFELEYDDIPSPGQNFDDYGDRWEGWEWDLDIRDVVIFGTTTDENAEYLFGAPDEQDPETTSTTDGTEAEKKEGETQYLRELTLVVRAPSDATGEADSVTLITFLPLVDHGRTAAPAGGGANPPSGN